MFGYENETSFRIYTSKQIFEKHVDLLPMFNTKNLHQVLIKDFKNLCLKKQSITAKKTFLYCLQCHIENYLGFIHTKSVSLTKEGKYDEFKIFKRLIKAPFIVYADFKCACGYGY